MKQVIKVKVMRSACRTDNGPGTSRLADVYASAEAGVTLTPVGGGEFRGPEFYRLTRNSLPGREWMVFLSPRDGGEWAATGDVPGLAYPEACRENPPSVGGGFTSAVTAVRETIADVVALPLYVGERSILQTVWGIRHPTMFTPRSIAGCYEVGVNPLPRIRALVPGLDIRFLRTAVEVMETADATSRYWEDTEPHGVVPLGYAGSCVGHNGYLVW
jgi:hypothetical protein